MCGICGIVSDDLYAENRNKVVNSMNEYMKHRGPDYSNSWSDEAASFGHVRLSIIDLSSRGHQPMESFDKRYVLSFNGEIYNYKKIRRRLINLGIAFKGDSDSEVLINAWAIWGEGIVKKLNGIFAFSIWDRKKKDLYLVRDRFGVKPLFYFHQNKRLIFSSEVKPLIRTNLINKDISYKGLHQYSYFGTTHSGQTLFDEIKQVKPAEILRFNGNTLSSNIFWNIENISVVHNKVENIMNNIRTLMESAVKEQLVSDVPVGILLSGGVDSSIVTAYASKHYYGKIDTYSAGFDFEKGVNELPMARKVSSYYNTNHNELVIAGHELPFVLEDLIDHHGVPFGDAANIPLYLISKELKGSHKVIMQGDGGDEMFGGYRSYKLLKNDSFWRFASKFNYLLKRLPLTDKINRLSRILDIFSYKEEYIKTAYLSTTDTKNVSLFNLFKSDTKLLLAKTDPFDSFKQKISGLNNFDLVQKMMYLDTSIQLPDVFLEKVDRATMAFGIESRVPFLENQISQYALSIPSNLKIRGRNGKWILRESMKHLLPDFVLNAKKTGFGVPYSYWLSTSLYSYAHDVFSTESYSSDSLFDKRKLFIMMSEHKKRPNIQSGYILWKALNFAIWKNKLNEK